MGEELDDTRARQLAAEVGAATGVGVRCTGYHRHNAVLAAARYVLANGLRVVLLPERRAPVFAYQTWFGVGSKHEDSALTGIAHLFEHLMFKATRAHPAGELDREMERRGTQTNAATWVDWTFYTETLAARGDNLETVIHFEADRMVNLLLDEETFRSEVEVVKNERRMVVEDAITGELSEQLYAHAFTVHPYRWPTIGAMAHLERATVADLERFYRAHYAPNNATVVIAGDLEPGATLTALARAYGPLPAQPSPSPAWAREPRQSAPRQVVLERPIVAPQLLLGFHAPASAEPDFGAVEMLGEILVTGDNGRLYHRLVSEEGVATDVSGSLAPFAEPGLYELLVALRPGADPLAAAALVEEELGRLARDLDPAERDKAQAGLELAWLDSLKDAEGCAEALGQLETNYAAFDRAFTLGERWQDRSVAELRATAAAVFGPDNATTVIARPAGELW